MTDPRQLEDIRDQPLSLRRIMVHHLIEGLGDLCEAAGLIRSGRRVVITGMGASLHSSIPLENALCSLGIEAVAVDASEMLHYRTVLCRDAVVVFVSRSGESVEIEKLLAAVSGHTAATIAVTNAPESTLALGCDNVLTIGSRPDEMVAIQSYTGTLLAFHLLVGEVAGAGMKYRDAAERTLASFTRLIGEAEEASLEWVEFLDPIVPTHLLARGPSLASALEGSLLFNETAKAPAVALTAGSFRHGPVEVAEEGFRSIIFAPAGRTRDLNLALARDLIRFGGAVRVVGPPGEDHDFGEDVFWPVPEVPEMLAPLVEVVPLQFAALRLAQRKGLDVGKFRHAGLVTRDESSFSTE